MDESPLTKSQEFDKIDVTETIPENGLKSNGISPKPVEKSPVYLDGPDQILPSDVITTTDPAGCVKIELGTHGMSSAPPISIPGLLARAVRRHPDGVALASKNEKNEWVKYTYSEYLREVRTVAKAFLKLGLQRHHSVCILGFNSPEWFISDVAAIFAGGLACGIYTTNSAEACKYCAENSRANIIVVQDKKQLDKILAIRKELPLLKAVIQYEGEPTDDDVLSWNKLREIGQAESDEQLDYVLKTMGVNQACTIVYTSGTVGNPKGVMLSHDNMTYDAMNVTERIGDVESGKEVVVSYLPLSHVAAQMVDIYLTMMCSASVYFADKEALKGSLVNVLQEVQPTRFLAVPRIYEKIHEKMLSIGARNGAVKKWLAEWAKGHGLKHTTDLMNGKPSNTWGYWLSSMLILGKIRAALGFTRCRTLVSAAAPISPDTKSYFMSLDMPIMEAFGMSESGGAHTLTDYNKFNLNTVGYTLPGVETKIDKPDQNGEGEICMRGRHIFMGYLHEEAKTAEAKDEDGWLHSGDIGKIDDKDLMYITGRIKEILITAGGENVPPVQIEYLVKAELPHLSNVVLIGDKRKFLTILVTLKTEMDKDSGAPLDKLDYSVKDWLKSLGCKDYNTLSEVLEAGPEPKLMQDIQQGIDRANKHAVSNAQRIQKFVILPADLSIPTGELGPTLKLKRSVITKKYADLIEKMYA
ncbi:very long-chain-fatty-acid--CoA ligase bubblegum-like [Ctenocephalides felis]|nr:very long-chain-fatty-acid--CoA ligase bubblegum-like [Ctenocephalides felis]